jgi:hypothetical protein
MKATPTMSVGSTAAAGEGDQVLSALESLAKVLEQNAEEERLLASRIRDMTSARLSGQDWLEVLSNEEQPGTVHLVSSMLARLSAASGHLRRSLVLALRAEGATIPVIAQLFGVTHQRVSNLLRRTSA